MHQRRSKKLASKRRYFRLGRGIEPLESRDLLSTNPIEVYGPQELQHTPGCTCPGCCSHPDLHFTENGRALFIDDFWPEADLAAEAAENADGNAQSANSSPEPEAKFPLDSIPQLSSDPSAPNTFYIDFDGQRVLNTDWNSSYNDGEAINARVFDIDGDVTTFSQTELDWMREIWERVSEDYRPFNINITTVKPSEDLLNSRFGAIRAIVTTNMDDPDQGGNGKVWFPGSGGVAFIGSWLEPDDTPVWVFQNKLPKNAKGIAEAVAHELGHAVGLSHHGDQDSGYYNGHGAGETGWAPIMGAGYTANMTQWSNGKYDGANNSQSDLSIIVNSFNRISYRSDDHSQGIDTTSRLLVDGNGLVSAQGMIEKNLDKDAFQFDHPGGGVNLLVKPFEIGGNLDVKAVIYDADGDEVETFAPLERVSATITIGDLEPGSYYLEIEGDGYAPADDQGYSDYGSLGVYTVEGSLGHNVLIADAGNVYEIDEGEGLSFDGSNSIGASDQALFAWDIDGDGQYDDATGEIVSLSWQDLNSLDNPIIDDGEFNISLQITDGDMVNVDGAVLVVANLAPQVSAADMSAFIGRSVKLSIDAVDIAADPLVFNWTINDGEDQKFTSVPTLSYTFDEPGDYSVKVEVGDDNPDTAEVEFVVSVADGDPIAGDTDYDGDVDFADFLVLAENFGRDEMTWETGDFDGDGRTEFTDFLLLSRNFTN